MISILETEKALKLILDPAAMVATYGIKPFKLVAYPGELEQLGQPINCSTVHIQFKDIQFEEGLIKFGQCCEGQINSVYFKILVAHNNLRCYEDVYTTSQAIIKQLRGKCVAVMEIDDESQGSSPATITDFAFDKVTNGGACYEASITIRFRYTDKFNTEKCSAS
jgi:hypothetical protein